MGALDSNSDLGFGKHWTVIGVLIIDYEIKIAITNSSDHLDVFILQSICLMESFICHKAFKNKTLCNNTCKRAFQCRIYVPIVGASNSTYTFDRLGQIR